MSRFVFCGECGKLKHIETEPYAHESTANYSWTGGFCHCDEDNQPNIDMGDYEYDPVAKIRFVKPKREEIEKDIEEAVATVRETRRALGAMKEIVEEYADYARQEIRFCPYCGAALGIL